MTFSERGEVYPCTPHLPRTGHCIKKLDCWSSRVAPWAKDLAVSLLWPWLQLWCGFHSWSRNLNAVGMAKKIGLLFTLEKVWRYLIQFSVYFEFPVSQSRRVGSLGHHSLIRAVQRLQDGQEGVVPLVVIPACGVGGAVS